MIKGEEIKAKRKAIKWSAQRLADYLGVEVGRLYKWEKGHIPSNPTEYLKLQEWLLGSENIANVSPSENRKLSNNSNNEKFLSGEISLTAQEYVNELKKDKVRLESLIETNLTAMMTLLSALHRHDLSFHEVMLEALARLEKMKNPRELIEEAHIRDHARMVEESLKDKLTSVDK